MPKKNTKSFVKRLLCVRCNKITSHTLTADGYKCNICGTIHSISKK